MWVKTCNSASQPKRGAFPAFESYESDYDIKQRESSANCISSLYFICRRCPL